MGEDSDVIYKGMNGKLDYGERGCVPVLTCLVLNPLETSKRRHPNGDTLQVLGNTCQSQKREASFQLVANEAIMNFNICDMDTAREDLEVG